MQIRNSPTTVQNVVTYDVVIGVSNKDLKLRPGMTANASIVTAQRAGVVKVPNAALRFKPPETATNKTAAAQAAPTNAATAKVEGTNKTETVAAEAPLTGNEPPEELMRRVREMRERGEDIPPEIRAKMRELFQSGALQRPAGGGGGQRGSQPSSRTVYVLPAKTPDNQEPTPQPVHIKTGITDGAYTEVLDGLKEGDVVITGYKYLPSSSSAPAANSNPFGGGGGRRF
jgi:HlyD family secretion protein